MFSTILKIEKMDIIEAIFKQKLSKKKGLAAVYQRICINNTQLRPDIWTGPVAPSQACSSGELPRPAKKSYFPLANRSHGRALGLNLYFGKFPVIKSKNNLGQN
jgi:hypothetical protein